MDWGRGTFAEGSDNVKLREPEERSGFHSESCAKVRKDLKLDCGYEGKDRTY